MQAFFTNSSLTLLLILGLFISFSSTSNAQCNFSISETNPCAREATILSVISPDGTYGWDFDEDGTIEVYGNSVSQSYPALPEDHSYIINLYRNNALCSSQSIIVKASPDPQVGVIPGTAIMEADLIRMCSPTPEANLQIINLSNTINIDQSYYIQWGDGLSNTYTLAEFGSTGFIEHDYSNYGYYNLVITAMANNDCIGVKTYTIYNGSNPSVGLANPGNTVGLCAPATLEFPITNYASNPPGTEYFVYISGELVQSFTQSNVPTSFSYTFLETSCGMTTSTGNYTNAFDVQLEAINPCGSSQATIEPIEVSTPPELDIESSNPEIGCLDEAIIFTNASVNVNEVVSGNPSTCESSLTPSWSISPGTPGIDWTIISGNIFAASEIEVIFHVPGNYTITMSLVSPACGPAAYSTDISIIDEPNSGATLTLTNGASPSLANECAPTVGTFINESTGDSLEFNWIVSPNTGWEWGTGSSAESENTTIVFNQAGTYTVGLNTINACATATWDTTFTIADTPIINLFDFGPYCETGLLNIDAGSYTQNPNGGQILSHTWSFPGAVPNNSSDEFPLGIFYDTPGIYEVALTVENQCGSTTAMSILEVEAPETLVIDNDYTVCAEDASFQLFATPSTGTWSGNGVSISGLFTPSEELVGSNIISYTYGNGACQIEDDLTVHVIASPLVNAGPNQIACINESPIILTGASPLGGQWSSNDGAVIVGSDAFDPAASGVGAFTLTYTFMNTNGCISSDYKTVIVHDLPTVNAGINISLCENPFDVDLVGYEPLGGTWSGPGVTPSGVFNASNTPGQGSYTLIYHYQDPMTLCSNIDSLVVTVVPNSSADAGAHIDLCISETPIALTDGMPTGGTWEGPGISGNGLLFDPSLAGAGAHVVTYVIGTGICETTDDKVITVHDLPELNLPPHQYACADGPGINLSGAQPLGGTWSGPGITGMIFEPSTVGNGVHTLTYNYTDQMTNCSAESSIETEVFPVPEITIVDSSYCAQGGLVNLPFTSPEGGIWSGPGITLGNQFDPLQIGGAGNYEFTYSIESSNNCEASELVNITIFPPAEINPGTNDSICIDFGILNMSGFSPGGGYWSGPGIVDSILGLFDPAIAGGGSHSLTYTYGTGNCQVQAQKVIYVIDLTGVGVGGAIEFCEFEKATTLTATGPEGGQWSGPGITNGLTGMFDPSLAGAGTHSIIYQYTDPTIGCAATAEKIITVHPQTEANFEFEEVICQNETVQFNNLSGAGDQYFWDFGDNSTTIAEHPLHVYDEPGTYLVVLITTSAQGCNDTIVKNILVTETPFPSYNISEALGCGPLTVEFANQSTGYDIDFTWDFGNGTTATGLNPDPVTFEAGVDDTTYLITLLTSNLCGTISYLDSVVVRPPPVADFGYSPEEPCSPMTVHFGNVSTGSVENFYWDFNNGNYSTDPVPPSQIYYADTAVVNYEVTLITENICGTDTATQIIEVSPPDVNAVFNVSAEQGCVPLTVDFTNYATPGANIDWFFGDGNSTIELNPQHTFTEAGTYKVIQYATSACGYDSTTIDIEVLPAPVVNFTHPTYICLGEPIQFTNTSQDISGAVWDFGDGTGSSIVSPLHIYNEPGTYVVTLIGASQFNQCPATRTSEIIVQGLPVANFSPANQYGCAPFNAQFVNNSTHAEFHSWDFGDGNTSIDANPTHAYEDIGNYEVSLIVTDTYGCSQDTSVLNIQVHPTPSAAFEFDPGAQCDLPATITFINSSEGAAGYIWNFGDSTTSLANQPSHSYIEEGTYPVSLIANNQYNCADTTYQEVRVIAKPKADFEAVNFEGCAPVTVTFSNSSTYGNKYFWTFGDGQSSEEEHPTLTFDRPGYYESQLIVSSEDICFDTIRVSSQVQVYENVKADFTATRIEDGFESGTYNLTNNSIGASEYYWEFSDGFSTEEISPSHRFLTNSAHQIYLEASNEFGCVDDTLLSLTPEFIKGLHIPNGFSPEQGIGDVRVFKPAGIGLKEYSIQVFSPYGQLLWESTELDEEGIPSEAWDGMYEGQLLPQDVYVWKASGMFRDGTVWPGEKSEKGGYKVIGSVVLLR